MGFGPWEASDKVSGGCRRRLRPVGRRSFGAAIVSLPRDTAAGPRVRPEDAAAEG